MKCKSIKLIINATYHPVIALKYVRIQHETTSTNVVQSPCKDFGNNCKNTKKKTRHNRGDLETQAFSYVMF